MYLQGGSIPFISVWDIRIYKMLSVIIKSIKKPRFRVVFKWCAQQESNLYLQLRRLTLYPLSYGRGKLYHFLLLNYFNIFTKGFQEAF